MDFPEINTVTKENLPDIMYSQYEILAELDEKLKIAFQKAQVATQSANTAASVKVGIIRGKKKAIQVSQQAIKDLAEGNAANTEAVKLVFNYYGQIAQMMKWLVSLSTLGLAMTRATINQLQLILKEGASDRLSEATKAELKGVIRDLKAQEDFMQKLARTETAVKRQEKRINKLEHFQKYLFGGVAIALFLVVALGIFIVRPINFFPDNTNQIDTPSMPSVTPETDKTPDSPANVISEIPEEAKEPEEQVQEQPLSETDDTVQIEEKPHSPLSNTQNGDDSIMTEESIIPQTPKTVDIDLQALEGTWFLKSYIAYINIFAVAGKYYIAFTVPNGGFAHYLPNPAELTIDGEYAVASYAEDNEGNHGTIKIKFSNDREPRITATMNDSCTPIYSSADDLLYLIVSDSPMYSDPDMKDYPVYKEYLDPALFGNL